MNRRITPEEVNELYAQFETPAHVIAHCRAVARTARKLALELNKVGYSLDLDLIDGAGLAHDVARTMDEHWRIGAEILESRGFFDEAGIVRCHMFYPQFNPVDKLDECDLICLGDRLVVEDKYAGLDARIDYILKKAPKDEKIIESILESKGKTAALLKEIEEVLGRTIDSIMGEE